MSVTRFNEIQNEIAELKKKITDDALSEEQRQIIADKIEVKKRELEKESLGEHKVVPVAAPIVGDKKQRRAPEISNLFYI